MKSLLQEKLEAGDKQDVDLAPLLDVVFILLIFFIVTSVFVVETGVEVDKPSAASTQSLDRSLILIAITKKGEIVYGGTNIGLQRVRNTISSALKKSSRPVIIQSDKSVKTELLVKVLDQVKLAGAESVSLATIDTN